MATGPKVLYEFGPFRVDPDKQVLLRENQPVPITPKAIETLLVLVRRSREVVSKDELMKELWPNAFVEEANLSQNIFVLRKALGDTPEDRRYIVTLPGRGYRFVAEVRAVTQNSEDLVIASHSRSQMVVEQTDGVPGEALHRTVSWKYLFLIGALLGLLVLGTAILLRRHPTALRETDSVLIADFTNTTGDPVFDATLRQGLAIQLGQSPFVSLVSDERIQQTLRLMGQPGDARLTPQITHDLCQRTQSAVVIDGSIANLGNQYVLGLKAVSCRTGDSLAEEQVRSTGKEQVLAAMDKAAMKLREKLGESLNTLERFDTRLEQATTPSLEALQAYSLGRKTMVGKDEFAAAVPFYQRAIRLDPNFAMAYAALGSAYTNLGETTLAAENLQKAYDLRARVSERERFYIESTYYHYFTGDLEKARQVYELWSQTYPRYAGTPTRLGELYENLGQYDKALTEFREALRLDPARALSYSLLVISCIGLNRLEEAKTVAEEAQAKGLDSSDLRLNLYLLAFLQNDGAGMARQVQWAAGKAGTEDVLLGLEADTAAYFGRLEKSRDFSRRAVASAAQAEKRESAASYEAEAALRESLLGNSAEARQRAAATLDLSTGRDVQYGAALALAFAGDALRAQALADGLAKRFPEDTVVQFNYLPTIHAQLALSRNEASKAIDGLQVASSFELGSKSLFFYLYPIYVRGNAFLTARRGDQAAAEFQKLMEWRGVVLNEPIGALAHLGLARACVLQAQSAQGAEADAARAKATMAYQDFLGLWKDADPNIPIFKKAKSEYDKLP